MVCNIIVIVLAVFSGIAGVMLLGAVLGGSGDGGRDYTDWKKPTRCPMCSNVSIAATYTVTLLTPRSV